MATLVVGDVDVDTYGSIYDEERVVPSGITMDPPSSRPPSWKTKKLLMCAGIIGMTAAVASSALLFYSIMDFSKEASIGPSFLLHDSVGVGATDDNYCFTPGFPGPPVPWPAGTKSYESDDGPDGPHPTCFIFQGGENYCWSNSYYDDGWKPCTPKGFGVGWSIYAPTHVTDESRFGGYDVTAPTPIATCGTGCSLFIDC